MKKIPPTFIPAGIVRGSSEPSAARRDVLRGIATIGMSGVPILLMASKLEAATATGACLYAGEALARYGFPDGHPLGADRQGAFLQEAAHRGLLARVRGCAPRLATNEEIARFHTQSHIGKVMHAERDKLEFLDNGDTPVFPGVFEASASVVGAALDGLARLMRGECTRTFQPIGGLHHAGRDHAAGFCVFNDLGVVIETLRRQYGIRRVAYVDIDVHHGDGVFYAYEEDPDLIFADIHEDGRYLYPGTGREDETGKGAARGSKLNIPLRPGSGDAEFLEAWIRVQRHLVRFEPEFILFQCGADGLRDDPIAHLNYTAAPHAYAAKGLRHTAQRFCRGRLMAFGGGGYDRRNLAQAWSAVLREFV
jgi:acetoin utilization protein AcuC